ncbi:hypothetical protein R0131_04075 [Clostridium sp. AL.422]|uniref:hypothetical protein n=1 Tax=Clostridium TaxID=1485 RepID=UPI00293DCBE2|nr:MULTISPECIES: hypothetical protein [unclassified Clostridium]MDV4150007.1 hypothetical protein [Clostridium sp. AL.422]
MRFLKISFTLLVLIVLITFIFKYPFWIINIIILLSIATLLIDVLSNTKKKSF